MTQNIIYPDSHLGGAATYKVSASNYIAIDFSKNDFKLIPRNAFLYKIFLLSTLLLLLGVSKMNAQQNVNYAIDANIIYRFTKYVNWPNDKKTGEFIIGIVGESPLYDELKKITADKWVGNQKIVVKKFSSSTASFNCQILFVSEDKSSSMKKIASITGRSSTLLVSESDGLARKGSCINFIIVDERLKLEINKANIDERHLDIASELLSLGTIIKDPS